MNDFIFNTFFSHKLISTKNDGKVVMETKSVIDAYGECRATGLGVPRVVMETKSDIGAYGECATELGVPVDV